MPIVPRLKDQGEKLESCVKVLRLFDAQGLEPYNEGACFLRMEDGWRALTGTGSTG